MSSYNDYGHAKRTIQQLPIPERKGHNAILNSIYLEDIVVAIGEWSCRRVVLVHSKALDENTDVVAKLKEKLGSFIAASKSGVGAHSPYVDVLEIARMLNEKEADCLISIGSSSYSDACKIARLMQTNLKPSNMTVDAMEGLVTQEYGSAKDLIDPSVKLIVVPTSLSASEWNTSSSAVNPNTQKKQHFASANASPELILLDPEVASTAPRKLWLSSGMRAVDHCVETMVNEECTEDVFLHMEDSLAILLQGLKDYKDGESGGNHKDLVTGISNCQLGSRNAMLGLLMWNIPMGASHAIGHQLGSVCGVMHGITSCVMLAPVLRYTYSRSEKQKQSQQRTLKIWNKILKWDEASLADAIEKFVKYLGLPSTLREIGVEKHEDIEKVGEATLTDSMFDPVRVLIGGKTGVLAILENHTLPPFFPSSLPILSLSFGKNSPLNSPTGKSSAKLTSATTTSANSTGSRPCPHILMVRHTSCTLRLCLKNLLDLTKYMSSSASRTEKIT
ncbi:maleylacetate reductase [Plenodomus tracheiphilus IPT5]|uniref:Maleylacetate reductase n=1 Tax=Plenodomus tracheiphilus IPT5 TaxID=1408161 RepID=A0A6A7BAP6_9PLEO|nr:maleylacetate reductase [Plenodomus tracheiphilus IPT5]